MEKLFGIPMNSIMVVMLVLLILCLLLVAFIAWRRPVIFKLGVRNIPRRKTQSGLIVIGLMLATLIMSAALGVGDSLNHSIGSEVYNVFGPVDETIQPAGIDNSAGQTAQQSALFTSRVTAEQVTQAQEILSGQDVDAVGAVMLTSAPVLNIGDATVAENATADQAVTDATSSNPTVTLIGADQQVYDDFGGVTDQDGNAVDVNALGEGKVYVNQWLADDMNISVGQNIVYIIDNQAHTANVVGIVNDTFLAGTIQPSTGSIIVNPEQLSAVAGFGDESSLIVVSNTGTGRDSVDFTDAVVDGSQPQLNDLGLAIDNMKQDNLEQANFAGAVFTTMFVGFGLFSIAVGILLIVLIFSMLAAERRGEMGMERAVGAQRRQLIQQFVSEGAGYTLLAGLVGTALGIVAAWAITKGVQSMVGGFFDVNLYIHPRSMVIAYSLGVVITFLAVILSSWRASNLNVVAALRDLPDRSTSKKSIKTLVTAVVGIAVGAVLLWLGHSNPSITLFLIGITLVPFGLAQLASYFGLNQRIVLTIVGIFVLVVWLMPTDMFNDLFGNMGEGGIELFFLSGISIVAAATMIIVQNLDILLKLVNAIGSKSAGLFSAVRLGIAYPQSNPGRAGMTIAMFALIVFSIVVMSVVNNIFSQSMLASDANAGLDVRVDIPATNPVDDINAELRAHGVDMNGVNGPARMQLAVPAITQINMGEDGESDWKDTPFIYALDKEYLDLTQLRFQDRASGYDSDEAVRDALINDPDVMVIPSTSSRSSTNQQQFGSNTPTWDLGISDHTFEPYTIQMRGQSGEVREVNIIGVLDPDYTMLWNFYISEPTLDQAMPEGMPRITTYYYTLDSGVDPGHVADEMERALIQYGAQGTSVEKEMKEFTAQQNTFMTLLQWFMGLGLIVGVAAVGVIAYRSVVERRQQIGVLRAIGFQSGTVGRAFMIETAIIVILGAVTGALLGLAVAYNLTNDPGMTGGQQNISFNVPWSTVLFTLGAAIFSAIFMSWLPARQASSTKPAEALRYE